VPLFNAVYGHHTSIRLFDHESGDCVFAHQVQDGLLVGCAAAGALFALGQARAFRSFPGFDEDWLALIVDDLAMRPPDLSPPRLLGSLEQTWGKLTAHLAQNAGIHMEGKKFRVLRNDSVTRDTVFGGAVVAYGGVQCRAPLSVRRFSETCARLAAADLSLQDKLLLLRHANRALAYVFKSTATDISSDWIPQVQNATGRVLRAVVSDGADIPPSAWLQLHVPLRRAGGGLIDVQLAPALFAEATASTRDLALDPRGDRLYQRRALPSEDEAVARWLQASETNRFAFSGQDWQHNFLGLFPTLAEVTISDLAFGRALRFLLDMSSPEELLVCPAFDSGRPQFASLPPDHLYACSGCSATTRYMRHEKVLHLLLHKARIFGRTLSTNVVGLLGNARFIDGVEYRPDAFSFDSTVAGPCTSFYDVTVVHQSRHARLDATDLNCCKTAYQAKLRKYDELVRRGAFVANHSGSARRLQPLVFSTLGMPCNDTAEAIRFMGRGLRPGFARELIGAVTVCILESNNIGIASVLHANAGSMRILRRQDAAAQRATPAVQPAASGSADGADGGAIAPPPASGIARPARGDVDRPRCAVCREWLSKEGHCPSATCRTNQVVVQRKKRHKEGN
jgi:hypothetical protein